MLRISLAVQLLLAALVALNIYVSWMAVQWGSQNNRETGVIHLDLTDVWKATVKKATCQ